MISNIYNIRNITDLELLENAVEIEDEALLRVLETLYNTDVSKIGSIHPFLLRWVLSRLEQMNRLTDRFTPAKLNKTAADNLYNFALAKQSEFLNTVKMIKGSKIELATKTSKLKKFANVMFKTQMAVEKEQVKHNTEIVEKVFRETGRNMLQYVSEGDSSVRDEHQKADGTVLPAGHPFWNKAFSLLGEWNCRCEIIPVIEETAIKHPPKNLKIPTSEKVPTNINLDVEEGKVIIFKEELDVFKNQPNIVRKQYKSNGF